uniref:Uncharacterized protein n=1 Tax=Pithovirus LCPAC202 TaxID=2506592 RepID=A0A481Z578_9VIRU|nr:MAG: hypothetical protein LCPAC202_00170 [Pithovirus LCPAC202]
MGGERKFRRLNLEDEMTSFKRDKLEFKLRSK